MPERKRPLLGHSQGAYLSSVAGLASIDRQQDTINPRLSTPGDKTINRRENRLSLEACVWAWSQTLTPPQKLTLLALADRANAEGYCWPSRADMMHRTGLSHNTLAKCLAHLKREGLIRDTGERRGNRIVVWRVGHPKIETGIPRSGVTGIPKSGVRNLSGESTRTRRRAPFDDSEERQAAHAALSEPHWKRMGYPSEEAWEHEQRQKWEVEQERRARKHRKPPANAG